MTYIIYLFITLSLVLIDQFSKQIVTGYIDLYQKIEVIPGFFNLADSFLTVGVALLLIYTIFIEGKDGKTRN